MDKDVGKKIFFVTRCNFTENIKIMRKEKNLLYVLIVQSCKTLRDTQVL